MARSDGGAEDAGRTGGARRKKGKVVQETRENQFEEICIVFSVNIEEVKRRIYISVCLKVDK